MSWIFIILRKRGGRVLRYCIAGKLPEEAACREVMEETGAEAKAGGVLGIRCDRKNWYMLMVMDHVKGEPKSDHNENSEAIFADIEEAIGYEDVTHMTKVA